VAGRIAHPALALLAAALDALVTLSAATSRLLA